jgi:hypothetical protein
MGQIPTKMEFSKVTEEEKEDVIRPSTSRDWLANENLPAEMPNTSWLRW